MSELGVVYFIRDAQRVTSTQARLNKNVTSQRMAGASIRPIEAWNTSTFSVQNLSLSSVDSDGFSLNDVFGRRLAPERAECRTPTQAKSPHSISDQAPEAATERF